jgi:uncharacterized membrane protein YdfJ with MMPL/SSD domain
VANPKLCEHHSHGLERPFERVEDKPKLFESDGATKRLEEALHTSLLTSGKAIFFVSSAVSLGYMVLPFSGFSAWAQLGVLTAVMAAVSAMATLTIVPALIMTFRPRLFAVHPERAWPAEQFDLKRATAR